MTFIFFSPGGVGLTCECKCLPSIHRPLQHKKNLGKKIKNEKKVVMLLLLFACSAKYEIDGHPSGRPPAPPPPVYHSRRRVSTTAYAGEKRQRWKKKKKSQRVNERRVNQTFWAGGQLSSSRIKTHKTFRKSTRRNTHRKITQEMKKRFIKNGRKGKQEKTCEGPDRHEPSPRFPPSPVSPDSSSRLCLVLSRPSNYLSCNHQQQSSKETLTTITDPLDS